MKMIKKKTELNEMDLFLNKQPRSVIMSRNKFDMHQLRIVSRLGELLEPIMNFHNSPKSMRMDDAWFSIPVSDLVKGNNVKHLRKALQELMKKLFTLHYKIDGKEIEICTTFIQEYEYEKGSSEVKIKISGALLPELIDLSKGYGWYSVKIAFEISSPTIFKIYQYIASYRDKEVISCSVDALKKWLELEGKYSMPADIKKRILIPAMKELEKKADVCFSISERIIKNRKMIGWRFKIHKNDSKIQPQINSEKPLETLLGPPEKIETAPRPIQLSEKLERAKNTLLETFKLHPKQVDEILSNLDEKDVFKTIYELTQLKLGNKIRDSVGGFTIAFFKNKFPHLTF